MTEVAGKILGRGLGYRPVEATTPDGVAIAAQGWKRAGSRRDVLFIHGFSQAHLCWLKQVTSPLAGAFRLVTYDNRGHGSSGKPVTPPSTASHADGRTKSTPSCGASASFGR